MADRRSFTKNEKERAYKDSSGKCGYCGIELSPFGFHVDHIYPLSKGGSNKLYNLVATCRRCNLSKGNKTPEEFRKSIIKSATNDLIRVREKLSRFGMCDIENYDVDYGEEILNALSHIIKTLDPTTINPIDISDEDKEYYKIYPVIKFHSDNREFFEPVSATL